MELGPLLGLAGLLFVKEAGVPVPIPGDLLVLGAGVAASAAAALAPVDLATILVAGFLGGSLQFLLVRGALRGPLLSILARVGVSRDRLDRLADWLRRRGIRGVAVARATPGLRIGAISASGLAALPFATFVTGLVFGNTLFVGGHFLLGFVVGAPAIAVVQAAGGPVAAVAAFVLLAVVGAAGWAALRRRRRSAAADVPEAAGDWTEAACPACLGLGLLGTLDVDVPVMSGSA